MHKGNTLREFLYDHSLHVAWPQVKYVLDLGPYMQVSWIHFEKIGFAYLHSSEKIRSVSH